MACALEKTIPVPEPVPAPAPPFFLQYTWFDRDCRTLAHTRRLKGLTRKFGDFFTVCGSREVYMNLCTEIVNRSEGSRHRCHPSCAFNPPRPTALQWVPSYTVG